MVQARYLNAQNERKKTTKREFKTKQAAKE